MMTITDDEEKSTLECEISSEMRKLSVTNKADDLTQSPLKSLDSNDDSTPKNDDSTPKNDDSKEIRFNPNDDIDGEMTSRNTVEDESEPKLEPNTVVDESVIEVEPNTVAVDFFANLHYSNNRPLRTEFFARDRVEMFGDKTVKDLLEGLTKKEATDLFSNTGIDVAKGLACWEEIKKGMIVPEDVLNKLVCEFGGTSEMDAIDKYYVRYLPMFMDLADRNSVPDERKDDIRFVLGPSGSGKTFFSVKEAATLELGKKDKYVIVYIKMTKSGLKTPLDSSKIVELVKTTLLKKCKFDEAHKLKLHLSLVLDEAGSTTFNNYFEETSNMIDLFQELNELANKVRIVVCGTGLTAKNFGTDGDAKKYRMKPFSVADIIKLNDEMYFLDSLIIQTMKEHPALEALTTNGRTARFLLDEVFKLIVIYPKPYSFRSDIRRQMMSLAAQIIRSVANSYVHSNGIQELTLLQRCRVAAYIFDALERTRIEKTRNDIVYVPEFEELEEIERNVAMSLLSINVDINSNGFTCISENQKRSISISPALTVVVYLLSGVSIDTLMNWKMQEMNSALYEFRRRCCYYIICHKNDERKDGLNINLAMLRIIELGKRVPEPGAKVSFAIPLLDKNTIWVNGDKAPFADVVAPFILYQSKYRASNSPTFDLIKELGKCGLLKNSELEKCGLLKNSDNDRNQIGWIITKSLELMWNKDIERNEAVSIADADDASISRFFYPENQLIGPERQPVEDYATISEESGNWILEEPGGLKTNINIKENLLQEIVFVITCNQNIVVLEGNGKHKLTISCDCLDDDGNVQELHLAEHDRLEYAFYISLLKEKVKIRFLLS